MWGCARKGSPLAEGWGAVSIVVGAILRWLPLTISFCLLGLALILMECLGGGAVVRKGKD